MMKKTLVLMGLMGLGFASNAMAIESHANYLRCFSVDTMALVLQFESSSDNVQTNDASVSLNLSFYPVTHVFHGRMLPKEAKVELATNDDDMLRSVSASYIASDAEITLVVNSSAIKQDSFDGAPGNDVGTYTFPGVISVKVKTPGKENSYQESVRCRAELTSNGMAG